MMESKTGEPISKRKCDSSTDTDNLISSPPGMVKVKTDLLKSINDKLGILELVSKDMKKLKASLKMIDEKAATLEKHTNKLKGTVNKIETEVNELKKENTVLREALLDIQTTSMRENLVLTGIQEKEGEVPESVVREFLLAALQIPRKAINKIQLECVDHFGKRRQRYERPIVDKFAFFKDKIMVKSLGKRLAGTQIGMNHQFPKEIAERCKVLYPMFKESRLKGKRVALVVDKLYIHNQLFRDTKTTPWLQSYYR
jgi:hypothetical protein